MAIKNILVIGLGGIGGLVATMLKELGMNVTGMDMEMKPEVPEDIAFVTGDVMDPESLFPLLKEKDAVVSCLPYHLTFGVAGAARSAGIHYFDPTEDVETTRRIRQLAVDSKGVMIPQNGLAPGFIGILGAAIANQFDENGLRYIQLRVGALPQHPIGQLGYAGNWSLEGLIHECIAPCEIIEDSKRQMIPALRNVETLRIDGVEYEAFTTSGGLGTMCETYEGKVETLNYKSIRYPGHLNGMRLLIEELRFRNDPDALVKYIRNALPPDEQDRVLIHASVQGKINGKLQTKEIVTDYKPKDIAGKTRTAIAWTTAAAIVANIELVSKGKILQQGFIKQEDISLKAFLNTTTGKYYAEDHPILTNLVDDE